MKIHKLLLLMLSAMVMGACTNGEREIDYAEPNAFIEDVSNHFNIQEEPSVHNNQFDNTTTYYFEDISIEVNEDRELTEMHLFSNKEDVAELFVFLGLEQPKELDELNQGGLIDIFGEYVRVIVSRNDEETTQRYRKEAEENGMYYDERNDFFAQVLFYSYLAD